MAYGQIDPARLDGDALRRWYLRSPAVIEEERQLAANQKYKRFFGGLRATEDAEPAALSDQDRFIARAAATEWIDSGEVEARQQGSAPRARSTTPFRTAAAPVSGKSPARPETCVSCHGILPPLGPLLPPPIGTFPLPSGGLASFRDVPGGRSGGGSGPRRRQYPQCEMQYEADSEVCRKAKSRTCWENAAKREAHCTSNEGEIGTPALQFGAPGR